MCPSAQSDNTDPVIDLGNIGPSAPASLLEVFRSYPVIRSLLLLRIVEAPVLDGLVVTDWSSTVEHTVRHGLSKRGWTSVLVRTDAPAGYGFKPPGGNVYAVHEALAIARDALAHGRIPLLLEPRTRFHDEYSGNVIICEGSVWMEWEVVGHGFDLADLNRGHCSPHESFETYRGCELEDAGFLTSLDVRRHQFIEPKIYKHDWLHRLERVGKLVGCAHPDDEKLREHAVRFLNESCLPLLLDAKNGYSAMGYELLCGVHRQVYDIGWRLKEFGLDRGISVIGFSVIQDRGLVFWDVRKNQEPFAIAQSRTPHT